MKGIFVCVLFWNKIMYSGLVFLDVIMLTVCSRFSLVCCITFRSSFEMADDNFIIAVVSIGIAERSFENADKVIIIVDESFEIVDANIETAVESFKKVDSIIIISNKHFEIADENFINEVDCFINVVHRFEKVDVCFENRHEKTTH